MDYFYHSVLGSQDVPRGLMTNGGMYNYLLNNGVHSLTFNGTLYLLERFGGNQTMAFRTTQGEPWHQGVMRLITSLRNGYRFFVLGGAFENAYNLTYLPFITEVADKNAAITLYTQQLSMREITLSVKQAQIENFIERRAIAEYIIATAWTNLETVNQRITEIQALIEALEGGE